jgi:hypothetical protein
MSVAPIPARPPCSRRPALGYGRNVASVPPDDDLSPAPSADSDPIAPMPEEGRPQGMVPGRERRRTALERVFMRVVATGGIIGIGTALGAILVGQDVAGWIVGLAVSATAVLLAALLWSSRQL